MSDGVGLSVGATNLTAVVVGRTAVTRSPVVTLYPHRPPEVGVPSENPNLTERGLIITDFVDRVGDPVGIVAADGSSHLADKVLADALRAMLYTVGQRPAGPVAVTYPAHWRPAAVDALRTALAAVPEFQQAPLVSDASAALTALQDDPGVPTRGVIALCDFGGTGTSITLVDATNGFAPVGPTVRHTDLSGDLIDQALLTHVINDLSAAGTIDLSGTSAIGSLSRLRAQCRGAKERLSTAAVTSLVAELPAHRSDVRLTRTELDESIRAPLAEFVAVVQDTVERNGIRGADLVAVATAGGGARIPIITTTLSEHFRVPVITTGQPELAAAIGGGLRAVRGTVEEGATSMAVVPGVAAAAGAATAMAPEVGAQDAGPASSTFRALAWSDANDVPDVAPAESYDYAAPVDGGYDARPQMQFDHEPYEHDAAPLPWYRKPALVLVAGALALLAALAAAVLFVMRGDSTPTPASTTGPVTTTTTPALTTTAAAPPPETQAPAPQTRAPQTRTVTQQAPPPQTATEAPPPPPQTTEAPPPPPPTSEAPPPTTEAPPTSQPPVWSPTAPYPTIPGLPWVPAPQIPAQP
ncbi:molecular chaperone [Mycobacterium sp. JS623]|uniref:Hsp70 family protein n=1 Tax=Mycobacterium sp. JS623 TaxID=212767 RepID=UPI0002A56429|nr:Hsp70 family protein [Mycobacterium sp. JS623]AGB24266.1 molecular chaperone [Mycobacterium sp. JS623]